MAVTHPGCAVALLMDGFESRIMTASGSNQPAAFK
jgi:hypothetical protein